MKKGFIFDLDGTVYLGDKIIDGAREAIQALMDRGDKIVFLTNKSISGIETYVEKLNQFGIQANKENVINSNYLVAQYLKNNIKANEKVMVIGEQPLVKELEDAGIDISDDYLSVSYVVVGWDRAFTFEKLNNGFQAWMNGARIIATNPDRTCPVDGGQIPDCGAMIGALEGATGEKITDILGKPSPLAAKFIVEEILKLPPEQCFMVGDRLETDIKMGIEYGMQSVLVLTGITDKTMLAKSKYQPSFVLESISEIINLPIKDLNSRTSDFQKI